MAAFIVEIAPDLEAALRREAAKQGIDAQGYILSTLRERLASARRTAAPRLPAAEAALLQEINRGLSAESWQRYSTLKEKRRAETLTSAEQAELVSFSDQMEELNVQRMERLIQLARLRKTSVDALMDELGIKSLPYE
jgi:hypothetical protein